VTPHTLPNAGRAVTQARNYTNPLRQIMLTLIDFPYESPAVNVTVSVKGIPVAPAVPVDGVSLPNTLPIPLSNRASTSATSPPIATSIIVVESIPIPLKPSIVPIIPPSAIVP